MCALLKFFKSDTSRKPDSLLRECSYECNDFREKIKLFFAKLAGDNRRSMSQDQSQKQEVGSDHTFCGMIEYQQQRRLLGAGNAK
jgi:hypothetical protein